MSTASQFNQALQVHLQQQQQMKQSQGSQSNRPVIERGASWSYNETRILLSLWGQDMVQRQLTNSKRTRHVWEKIAERIRVHGFDRTADQVRTRVFNMIAEYRRILKNPTPERKKKCIFFDALHKIYQAKDSNGVRAALNNYEEDYNLEPIDFASGGNGDENDSNGAEGMMMHMTDANGSMEDMGSDEREEEVFSYAMSPSQTLNGHLNGTHDEDEGEADDSLDETMDYPLVNGPAKRVRSDSNYSLSDHQYQSNEHHASSQKRLHSVNSGHNNNNKQHTSFQSQSKRQQQSFDQQQQDAVQSFENSSCALLIDRMFAHLGKETEVMKEWVHLERERMAQEVTRRREEKEREERREKAFLSTLTRMQEQMFSYLSKQSSVDESNGHHASSALSSQSSPCNNNVNSAVDDGLESS